MTLTHKHTWIVLIKWVTIVSSGLLFLISLFFPALLFQEVDPVMGATLLGWGWWGLILGNPAWCANPIYLIAVITFLFKKYIFAVIGGGIAFLLGAFSFLATEYYFNEAGSTPIAGLGLAFYIWILSFGVFIGGSLLLFVIGRGE
ncbi:MAG TPA: hypothetical protein VJM08_06915 [Anaerolineales bacterium]|nr:hypothetical protein [Anaerolineales bacterium]